MKHGLIHYLARAVRKWYKPSVIVSGEPSVADLLVLFLENNIECGSHLSPDITIYGTRNLGRKLQIEVRRSNFSRYFEIIVEEAKPFKHQIEPKYTETIDNNHIVEPEPDILGDLQ